MGYPAFDYRRLTVDERLAAYSIIANAALMLFMLRISVEMMVLAVMLPQLWLGLLSLGVITFVARRRIHESEHLAAKVPPLRMTLGLLSMTIVPLMILVWGWYFWPDESAGRGVHEQIALRGLYALALAQLFVCLWIVWRARGRPRVVVGAAVAMWWAAGALGTASMAVTNTWL